MMKCLAAILFAAVTATAAEPIVNVVGVTEFEVPARDPAKVIQVSPPIALVIANDMRPDAGSIRAKLGSVSVGTTARPEYSRAFEFGSFAAGKKGELRDLSVKVNLDEIPDPQTYVVKVLLFRDGDTSITPQALDLRFTRPSATLSVSPLRLENRQLVPVFRLGCLSPDQLKLQETSQHAALTEVQIQVKDYLKGPDDFPVAAQLQASSIARIDAGKDATTQLEFAGRLPLGSSKGTLVVRSRQLAQPLEVVIEIVTRTSRFWLIGVIGVSIWMGYLFRILPERRRAENLSRIAAERQFGLIKDLKAKAVDPDLVASLDGILGRLQGAIEEKPFVATRLDEAAKRAGDEVDALMKEVEQSRAALRTRIKELRVKLDFPQGQPRSVAQAVANLIGRLDKQDHELKGGALGAVSADLGRIETEISTGIPTTIATWLLDVHAALGQMGQWQGLEFEDARKRLFGDTSPAKATTIDLAKTRQLSREIQVFVLGVGLQQVTEIGAHAAERLERLKLAELKPNLHTCRKAIEAARNLGDVNIDRAGEVALVIEDVRTALINLIQRAATLKKVAGPDGLNEGDFAKAMAALSDSMAPQERAWGSRGEGQPDILEPPFQLTKFSTLLSAATSARPIARPLWELQLNTPLSPTVGEQAVASVVVIGESPGLVDLEWLIDNSVIPSGAAAQTFTPAHSGALAILVRGVVRSTGEIRTASAVIQARGVHGFAAASSLADQMIKDERIPSIVSGVFIVAAGYAIFQGTWYGTFMDFLAAMLWGFSVDVSVAKVREIAGPLMGRSIPLPTSRL